MYLIDVESIFTAEMLVNVKNIFKEMASNTSN